MNQKPFNPNHFILTIVFIAWASVLSAQEKFTLSSAAFEDGKAIPAKYTCSGENLLPALNWSNVPKDTKSFAIIMDDPDANDWVHWVIYDIPVNVTRLTEGSKAEKVKAVDGLNSWDTKGYSGPCPPDGSHTYLFKIYALDKVLEISDMIKGSLLEAMKGHILDEAQLTGTFRQP